MLGFPPKLLWNQSKNVILFSQEYVWFFFKSAPPPPPPPPAANIFSFSPERCKAYIVGAIICILLKSVVGLEMEKFCREGKKVEDLRQCHLLSPLAERSWTRGHLTSTLQLWKEPRLHSSNISSPCVARSSTTPNHMFIGLECNATSYLFFLSLDLWAKMMAPVQFLWLMTIRTKCLYKSALRSALCKSEKILHIYFRF